MELTFTKGAGKVDRLVIVTAAGAQPVIDCPKQGIIPHDMVHFAVESEVAACGFLGGIAAGGDSGYGAGIDDPHHRAVERLVETVQAEAWGGAPVDDADFRALYHVTCDARGDAPLDVHAATLAAIRARLTDLTARWAAVPVGGSLVLRMVLRMA
ncbi:hypothetical protein [Polymorphobacter fuscus]|uniref:Uncharacterized protein n=1 Tax=Sandarakinorhabdus fusca TaxID=1439888 RepID=A0A7C9GQ84_9SPHN|nr:hypothetical protein [Polymorphobacter fuscus]KAB7644823.1 hypothetical protein F9290_12600 [Polymorphobacter fuscus]MQT18095.1 hypothetical protein [Polymorphobacter fuscus]NJC09413.1 hypothetical protein [Polymorphobacter fuscus]